MRQHFAHGLVIGKFYPPHLGHIYLIRAAAQYCCHVTVGVLAASVESIPLATRVEWLRQCFADQPHVRVVGELDDLPVDYADATIWDGHIGIMRQAITQADGLRSQAAPPVDAIFSSEPYGEEMALRFNAAHVCLDQTRSLYPVSGSAVRADVVGTWHLLPEPVRAGLTIRVIIIGAESSGTTTLARDLCTALRERGGVWAKTQYVAEYGREFSATLQAVSRTLQAQTQPSHLPWQEADFVHIAHEQTRQENLYATQGSPVLICDTDALATCIWHERYRHCRSQALEDFVHHLPARALYLLTSHEGVAFEDDGLRDGEYLRAAMTQRFIEVLSTHKTPWIQISGLPHERLQTALHAIEHIQASFWSFAPPLPQKNTHQGLLSP